MTDLGGSYGQPPQAPPPSSPSQEPPSDIPTWMLALAVLLVVGLTGALLFVITHQSGDESGPAAGAPSEKSFPEQWDKRIAPYARIAAKQRGLQFLHPVPVRFLGPKAFERTVTKDSAELTNDDRQDIENSTGLFRALGLLSGNVDLLRAVNSFRGGGILAYYSYRDQRITVRGHVLTPAVKSTLVHELTHVLQDQHFHIGDRMKKLRNDDSDTRSSVLDAIIEGDAERVQRLYRNSLSPRRRAALDAAQRKENAEGQRRISRVPPALVTMLTSSYTLGQALVETTAAKGGNGAVDRLFRNPPAHETVLLDPSRVVSHQTGATHVATPALKSGEKKFGSGELGVLTWYFMLGERIPLTDALSAADGWGGDAYVGYRQKGMSCVRASFVGHAPADTDRMYADLQRWIASGSSSTASVSRHDASLDFQSCDPGTTGASHPDTTQASMSLLATRAALAIGLTKRGLPAATARCMAGRMVDTWTVSELDSPTFGSDDPATQTTLQQMAVDCR